jgi:hypothetical protein
MIGWKALIVAAALALGTSGFALAARTNTPASTNSKTATSTAKTATSTAKTVTHHEMGTIDSITDSDLVLTHKYNGKVENTKFVVNADTKKDGTIDKGSEATVYYKFSNHQRVATEIKAEPKKS